ncbi:hypothetical protein [Spirillospora sp. NPDC047279]|uniref:hypothetical protein n=1 Tax=Spirillospora sp. NPDC047279 TaxID=3155478 RepID=UPI00340624C6
MKIRSRRSVRIGFAAALLTGGLLSAAPGCTTNTCVNGACTVTFEDGASSATVGGLDDVRVEILGIEGDRVRVAIGGAQGTVAKGTSQAVGPYTVSPTEISAKKIVLKVSR